MKNLVLILIAIIFGYGCKKDSGNKNTPTFYGDYHSASTVQLNRVIMLTKNSTITDTVFIKKFLSRTISNNAFYFNVATKTIGSGFVDLNMNGKDDVKITVNEKVIFPSFIFPTYTISGHIVLQLSSEFLIQSSKADSSNFPAPDTTLYSVEKYKPFFRYIPYSSSLGNIYTGLYIGLGRQSIVIQSGNYCFPWLNYFLKSHIDFANGGFSDQMFGNTLSNNMLNPNLQNQLGTMDTVVFQTGLIKLIKQ